MPERRGVDIVPILLIKCHLKSARQAFDPVQVICSHHWQEPGRMPEQPRNSNSARINAISGPDPLQNHPHIGTFFAEQRPTCQR